MIDSEEFASWVQDIDYLCLRFLDIELEMASGFLSPEDYETGYEPAEFFLNMIIPDLQEHHGYEFINTALGEVWFWGQDRPYTQVRV